MTLLNLKQNDIREHLFLMWIPCINWWSRRNSKEPPVIQSCSKATQNLTRMQQSNHSDHQLLEKVVYVSHIAKLLPFWQEDPELWFTQVEAAFSIFQITCDDTKLQYVVATQIVSFTIHLWYPQRPSTK